MNEQLDGSIEYLLAAVDEIMAGHPVDTDNVVMAWEEFMEMMIAVYGRAMFVDAVNADGTGGIFDLASESKEDESKLRTILDLGKVFFGKPRPQNSDRTVFNKVDISLIRRYLKYATYLRTQIDTRQTLKRQTKELNAKG